MVYEAWCSGLTSRNLAELAQERGGDPKRILFACDDGRVLTFAQFWELAAQLANALSATGAVRGDRVAAQVDKSVEALALFWACVRSGLVFLPLNSAYIAAEVSYFLEDAAPRIFVTTPQRCSELQGDARTAGCSAVLTLDASGGGSLIEAASMHDRSHDDYASAWEDPVAILYTSGTTGRSKGAILSHGNLASNGLALVETWAFTAIDKLIHALPIYHTHGLFTATNTLMLSGGTILFQRKFDVEDVLRLMPQATCLMGVPTFYTRLLQHPGLTREATAHMRLFISGSAPLLKETHTAFAERTGHAILERYGMTETNMITSNPYRGERRAGTVGLPLPHVQLRVADPASHEQLSPGETGMIEVKGPNVFAGYWRKPQKTAEDFTSEGFFITGDLGSIDGDGYLTISGRAKDLVISGGFNIYPKEIELLVDALPGVAESAVIGLPHPDFGEAITAIVVPQAGMKPVEQDMVAALKSRLAGFKVPKRVLVVPELPRNAMGKVQKAVLRQTYARLYLPV